MQVLKIYELGQIIRFKIELFKKRTKISAFYSNGKNNPESLQINRYRPGFTKLSVNCYCLVTN